MKKSILKIFLSVFLLSVAIVLIVLAAFSDYKRMYQGPVWITQLYHLINWQARDMQDVIYKIKIGYIVSSTFATLITITFLTTFYFFYVRNYIPKKYCLITKIQTIISKKIIK
ncbi:hypothetical protein N8G13_00890 [Mycoplasma zalophi]|uniref:hypothetical protein n=1 Tax=Mycoplasma zalophi TaxID=191287 RepID=UPI0021C74F26|nr:hypothetical protein [Mycoplasma zalophi]MCU4117020.1 hypothetical protein [Mycoplasma zalophi]